MILDQQRIKLIFGPSAWEDLKKRLAAECERMSDVSPLAPRFIALSNDNVFLKGRENGRNVSLIYVKDVPCVIYRTPRRQGQMDILANPDGSSVDFVIRGAPQSPEDIAFNFVRETLETRGAPGGAD